MRNFERVERTTWKQIPDVYGFSPPKYYLYIIQNQVRVQSWSRILPERTEAGTSKEYNSVSCSLLFIYILSCFKYLRNLGFSWARAIPFESVFTTVDCKQAAVQHRAFTKGMLSSCRMSRTISLFSCVVLVIRIYPMCAVSFLADKWGSV